MKHWLTQFGVTSEFPSRIFEEKNDSPFFQLLIGMIYSCGAIHFDNGQDLNAGSSALYSEVVTPPPSNTYFTITIRTKLSEAV